MGASLLALAKSIYYIGIMLKNILKTLTANFMNSFHVGNARCSYKALE